MVDLAQISISRAKLKADHESFNGQLSAFRRLAYEIRGAPIAKWLSVSVNPLCQQHLLDAICASKSTESKTPSQWNDGSMEAGLRRRLPLLANCHMALLMPSPITQLHEC
jgi:hypothetical protein